MDGMSKGKSGNGGETTTRLKTDRGSFTVRESRPLDNQYVGDAAHERGKELSENAEKSA